MHHYVAQPFAENLRRGIHETERRIHMKKFLSLMLTLAMLLGMMSISMNALAEEPIVIKLSMAASDAEKVSCESAIARFEEKYPNCKVDAEFYAGLSWDEIIQKQLTQFASGTYADVVYIAIEGTQLMVNYGLFQPIDDLIEADKDYFSPVPESAFKAFEVNGKYYEVPFNCNDMCIVYNTKMFQEAGIETPGQWTVEEYLDALGKIDAYYNKPDTPNSEKVWGVVTGETPYMWAAAYGTSVLNDDWTASNITSDAMKEVLQFQYDLVYKYGYSPVRESNTDEVSMFCSNRLATFIAGPYILGSLKNNNFTDWDIAIVPRGKENGSAAYGVGGLGMMTGCQHRQEAFNLMKEFCSIELSMTQATEATSLPLFEEAANSEAWLAQSPLPNASKLPSPICYAELNVIMKNMMTNIVTKAMTIDEAVALADQEIAAAYEEFEF